MGWLEENAKKAGYQPPKKSVTTSVPPPRLKGKARKEARDAAAASKIDVSQALDKLFTRTIQARAKASTWLQAHHGTDNEEDTESHQRHSHFIQVLQTAASILMPLVKHKAQPKPNGQWPTSA